MESHYSPATMLHKPKSKISDSAWLTFEIFQNSENQEIIFN